MKVVHLAMMLRVVRVLSGRVKSVYLLLQSVVYGGISKDTIENVGERCRRGVCASNDCQEAVVNKLSTRRRWDVREVFVVLSGQKL